MDVGAEGVLALVRILEDAEKHVNKVDEEVCDNHALPEVPRITHLGHKVEENHGSTIGVNDSVDALVGTEESSATRCVSVSRTPSKCSNRLMAGRGVVGEVRVSEGSAVATECTLHCWIIGCRSSAHSNRDDGYNDSCPNGKVGQPSKSLKSTNLTQNHTEDGDYEEADDKTHSVSIFTVFPYGNLRDRSSKTEDKHGYQHEHLKTLQNVDQVSHRLAIDAEECLSKVTERVAVAVHVHENTPDVPARDRGHQTEHRVESDTGAVSSIGECPPSQKSVE